MRAEPDFTLGHYPTEWEMVETENGLEWLPRLKKLALVPGVNGVRQTRNGVDDRIARTTYTDQGWTLIPRDLGYVTAYPTTSGTTYLLTWDRPKRLGNRCIVKHDDAGFNAFRRSLIEDGVIERPDPDALEAIAERLRRTIARNEKNAHIAGVAEKIEADRELLAAMREEPKPKKRGGRKAKADA
tara:strand:- start:492 stop:1046 length:555 start_codon:yes stop_codon:yes gene_type:complete